MERVVGLFPRCLAGIPVESTLFQRQGHTRSAFGTSKIRSCFHTHLGICGICGYVRDAMMVDMLVTPWHMGICVRMDAYLCCNRFFSDLEGFPTPSALAIQYFYPLTQSISYTHLGICGICGYVRARRHDGCGIKRVMFANMYRARWWSISMLPGGYTRRKQSIPKRGTHMILIWDIQNWVHFGSKLGQNTC